MRRRLLTALLVLLGEPVPHEWTDCPNTVSVGSETYVFPGFQWTPTEQDHTGQPPYSGWETVV